MKPSIKFFTEIKHKTQINTTCVSQQHRLQSKFLKNMKQQDKQLIMS